MRTSIELEDMIPSQDIRKYLLELGWKFTDREMATLLIWGYSNSRPVEKLFSGLQTLHDETDDQELRRQIEAYLGRIGGAYQAFQKNDNKDCIYILKIQDEDNEEDYYPRIHPKGYFFDFEMACEYGRKEKVPFQIIKNSVGDPAFVEQHEDGVYYDYEIDHLDFNRDGIAYFFSCQLNDPPEISEDPLYRCFSNAFVEIPNLFERGDIVRFVGTEDLGIVETSHMSWKEDLERHRKNGWKRILFKETDPHAVPLEFGDDCIRVAFLNDDGTFSHRHVIPFNLERYHPELNKWHRNDNPRDNLLLYASDLYVGEGSLDELWFYAMEYRESEKQR